MTAPDIRRHALRVNLRRASRRGYAAAMIYVHETHEIAGGKMEEFAAAVRDVVAAAARGARRRAARVVLGADARDRARATRRSRSPPCATGTAWGDLVGRGIVRDWQREAAALRKDVVAKVLLPAAWSPLQAVDLDDPWPLAEATQPAHVPARHRLAVPGPARGVRRCARAGAPAAGGAHRHDVGGRVLDDGAGNGPPARGPAPPAARQTGTRSRGCSPEGEHDAPKGGWMEEGLRYRDRWESKLLRCARWSPRQ